MKKILALTAAAAMIAGTAVYASAYCGSHGRYYTDTNGDGICDYCGAYSCEGHGRYYTDADGNGVCDNYGTGAGCHAGRGHHGGGRRG